MLQFIVRLHISRRFSRLRELRLSSGTFSMLASRTMRQITFSHIISLDKGSIIPHCQRKYGLSWRRWLLLRVCRDRMLVQLIVAFPYNSLRFLGISLAFSCYFLGIFLAFLLHVLDICLVLLWVFWAFLYMSHHFQRIPYIPSLLLLLLVQGPDACAVYCCIPVYFLSFLGIFFAFSLHFFGVSLAFSRPDLDICLVLLWVFSAFLYAFHHFLRIP